MKKKRGPWTIVGTKAVYKNPWISVREDKVIRPDGKKGIFGVVSMVPGVSVLAIDENGSAYLTKEYHYGVGRTAIEAMGGGIDKGENRLQAAKRELREETGFTARKWTYIGVVDPFTTVVVSPNHLYLAEELTVGEAKPEGTEKVEIIKIPFKKAVKWVLEGKITHSASVALILKTQNYLKN